MKRYIILTVLFLPRFVFPEDWRAGLSISQGANYAFIRAGDQQSMIGHSMGIEVFMRRHKSLDGIFFEPGIRYGKNTLRAGATDLLHVRIQQHTLGLSVNGGLLISKAAYVKLGVLAETVGYGMVETVDATGVRLGRSEFDDHLHPRRFMGGIIAGVGGAPGTIAGDRVVS